MNATTQPAPVSKALLWTGHIMSILPALLLIFSAVMKFMKPAAVVEGFAHFGLPERLLLGLGIVELICTILYLIPRTAILGAILLTGYLGGATLANLRVGESYVMTVILGIILWGGLFLRDRRVRALIPFRQ